MSPLAKGNKTVVALGVFDGVHRGHRELFRKVIARAKALRGKSVVYTFEPHPVTVVAPSAAPRMINTLAQRIELIESLGIDKVVVQKFTKAFSRLTPEAFFEKVIVETLKAREIFVGYNFTFGVKRSGTVETLEALGRPLGVDVRILSPFLWKETLVSSTQARQYLAAGDLSRAEDLLARPYFIEGKVVRGRGIGGKQLGIHTANLASDNDALLPTGVYVTQAVVGTKRLRSVTNIGPNPTFTGARVAPSTGKAGWSLPLNAPSELVTIETHILEGFHKNIVGQIIRVEFLRKIREEICFAHPADLARQIGKDIKTAERIFMERK